MPRLSKSRIMSSLQCLKKVWLEVHHPELKEFSPATQAAFDNGHRVGEAAIGLLGTEDGTYIDYEGGSFANALDETRRLMNADQRAPVYEAT